MTTRLRHSERISRQRADALASVAAQSARIAAVTPADAVLEETARALERLGFGSPRAYQATANGLPPLVAAALESRRSGWSAHPDKPDVLVIATPVCADDRVLGAVTVEAAGRNQPGTVDLEVLEILAVQAARALESARRVTGPRRRP